MAQTKTLKVLSIIAAAVLAVGVVIWYGALHPKRARPEGTGNFIYYTGPMKQKFGTIFATEDGKVVPPPPGAEIAPPPRDPRGLGQASAETPSGSSPPTPR